MQYFDESVLKQLNTGGFRNPLVCHSWFWLSLSCYVCFKFVIHGHIPWLSVAFALLNCKKVHKILKRWSLVNHRFGVRVIREFVDVTQSNNEGRLPACFKINVSPHIRAQFHQCSTYSFYACRSRKRKKILMTSLYFFRFWDLRV